MKISRRKLRKFAEQDIGHLIVWLQEISTPSPPPMHGRLLEIQKGRGSVKLNFLKEIMELKWNFQGRGGNNTKTPFVGPGENGHLLEPDIVGL